MVDRFEGPDIEALYAVLDSLSRPQSGFPPGIEALPIFALSAPPERHHSTMNNTMKQRLFLAAAFQLFATNADEGMWLLHMLQRINEAEMQEMGLNLSVTSTP